MLNKGAAEALVGFRGIVPEGLPSGELPKAKRQAMLSCPCSAPQRNETCAFRESTGFEKQLAQPPRKLSLLAATTETEQIGVAWRMLGHVFSV